MSLSDDEIWALHEHAGRTHPLDRGFTVAFARAVERAARAQVWREAAEVCKERADIARPRRHINDDYNAGRAEQASHLDDEFRARAEKEQG